jgi:ABC-type taurine transport system ATPase subunit
MAELTASGYGNAPINNVAAGFFNEYRDGEVSQPHRETPDARRYVDTDRAVLRW